MTEFPRGPFPGGPFPGGIEPAVSTTATPFDETEAAAPTLADLWSGFDREERLGRFRSLGPTEAGELFLGLPLVDQGALILDLPPSERRLWLRLLAPDDAADLIQYAPEEARASLL